MQCYQMDSEMFTGDQKFTEEFIQVFIDRQVDLIEQLKRDKTFFCFACKKKKVYDAKGKRVDAAEFTEDPEDQAEAE